MRDIDFVLEYTGLDYLPQPLNYYAYGTVWCIVVGYFYYCIFSCLAREDDSKLNYEDADGPSRAKNTKKD